MSRPLVSLRKEMVALQKEIARQLRDEVLDVADGGDPELLAYRREYENSFRTFRRRVSREQLLRALSGTDFAFQGDFHTLRACQNSAIRLLTDLVPKRRVVLAVEMIAQEHQASLDRFLAGEIDERRFLELTDYRNSWGFDWRNYRDLFRLARHHAIPVYGTNVPGGDAKASLHRRDRAAASVIARAADLHPGALVYVIAGDFHVCRGHLPAAVGQCLGDDQAASRFVILHQNVDAFYWRLVEKRLEHQAEVLEIGPGEFCLMNSTPMAKYQSYLHWELGHDEMLEGCFEGAESSAILAEEVERLVQTVCRFLDIDTTGLDDYTVYTASDFDFLEQLREKNCFTDRELKEIQRQIENQESYFIPAANVIYLASLSIDHAAEEASHYINCKKAGFLDRPLPARTDFYYRTLKEALGFFGSKVINPLRCYYDEHDLSAVASRFGDDRTNPVLAPLFSIATHVLQHVEADRRFLETGKRPRLRRIYDLDVDIHLGVTHTLGYILGARLYDGVLRGALSRSTLRELFHLPLDGDGEAEEMYFNLVRRVGGGSRRRGG